MQKTDRQTEVTRLATANIRVSIRVTKFLARAGCVVNPSKIIPSSRLITMQNLVTVSHVHHVHM